MFWYYAAPYVGEKWNVLFEDQPKPYIYDDREAAIAAAREAAEKNAKKSGKASGVRIKEADGWKDDETYGEE
jgi:hypothetical protein